MNTPPRIAVVSENLLPPFDEGIKKFAASLIGGLSLHSLPQGLSVGTTSDVRADGDIISIPTNRLFLSSRLRRRILDLAPDVICYVPSASCTIFSFLRARLLKRFCPSAKVAMVALQGRNHSAPARYAIRLIRPDAVYAQSGPTIDYLASLGCQPIFLPSGVDLGRFRPATAAEKSRLRAKYGLPPNDFLVLHVGHLKDNRNLGPLTRLSPHGTGVLVAARSMGQDGGLHKELKGRGIIIVDSYVEEVQEIYQACDCYLFPVRDAGAAIDLPLTVLEAMACNLPVVAYRFGGLPLLFEPGDGFWFADEEQELLQAIGAAKASPACRTRRMVEPYSWENIAERFLGALEGVEDVKGRAGALA